MVNTIVWIGGQMALAFLAHYAFLTLQVEFLGALFVLMGVAFLPTVLDAIKTDIEFWAKR